MHPGGADTSHASPSQASPPSAANATNAANAPDAPDALHAPNVANYPDAPSRTSTPETLHNEEIDVVVVAQYWASRHPSMPRPRERPRRITLTQLREAIEEDPTILEAPTH